MGAQPVSIFPALRWLAVGTLALAMIGVRDARSGETPGVTDLEGRTVPSLLRRPTAALRVYAFHGEGPEPIPFQIDERDFRNRFAVDQGPGPIRDESPGILDANDEIVFVNRDLGSRGDPAKLPANATWLELRVGPEASPLGFAYVGAFAEPPELETTANCCRYDFRADRVFAERYAVGFGKPLPTHLGFVQQIGDFGQNVLAAVRARGEARILGGLITLRRSDKDLRSELQGYREGPVRLIRHSKYWIVLPLGFKAMARVDLIFYRNFVEGRATAKVTIPPRLVPADGDLTAYFDFLDFSGARLMVQGRELSPPIDGHMTEAKRQMAGASAHWAALLLPNGRTFLLAMRLGGSLKKLDQRLYFVDGTNPDGGRRENKTDFGFQLSGINRLDTGLHDLIVTAMLLDSTAPDEITKAASFALSPPEVTVSPLPNR